MRARTSEHLNTLLYCLFLLLLILTVIPAQEISHPLSSNGTDPTEPRTRFISFNLLPWAIWLLTIGEVLD